MQQSQTSRPETAGRNVPAKTKRGTKKGDTHSQGVTLVTATPTKIKVRGDSRNYRLTTSQSQSWAISLDGEDEDGVGANFGDSGSDMPDKEGSEELWLPISPDVLLVGARKRAASGSSSSIGLSDPTEEGMDTPVKKRVRIL